MVWLVMSQQHWHTVCCYKRYNSIALSTRAIPCSHVLEVINDPKPPVRAAAIEALGRAITGALGSLPAVAGRTSSDDGGAGGPSRRGSESSGGVEHMLLVALEALYNNNKERDVRLGVLRVLLNVLQVGGRQGGGAGGGQVRMQVAGQG